jgi:hypothetical protein
VQDKVRYSGIIEIPGLPTRPKLKNAAHIPPEDASDTPSPDERERIAREERLLERFTIFAACTPDAATTRTIYDADGLRTGIVDGRGDNPAFPGFFPKLGCLVGVCIIANRAYEPCGDRPFSSACAVRECRVEDSLERVRISLVLDLVVDSLISRRLASACWDQMVKRWHATSSTTPENTR